MSQFELEEQMSKLKFNPNCEVATRIKRKIEAEGKFPKCVVIEGFSFPCRIYGGLIKLPVKLSGKTVKDVWINDVIFRYLPNSLRMWRGKRYIIKEITIERVERGRLKPRSVIMEDLSPELEGVHKTVSHVKTHIITNQPADHPYQTIIVEYEPLETNYVARVEKDFYDEKSGRYLKVPHYYVIRSYQVPDIVRLVLRRCSRDFTRGFKLELKVPSEIMHTLPNLRHDKDLNSLLKIFEISMGEYVHLAIHIILNQIIEGERWNPRDLDHYVDTAVNVDEELKQRLREIFVKNENYRRLVESLLPRLSVTVVVGSKADLLKDFDWNKVKLEKLDGMSNAEFESELMFPRCFVMPDFTSGNPYARKIIISLARMLLEELKTAADKVKVY